MPNACEQSCATCRWWQRMGARLSNAIRDPGAAADTGTCQVRAPSVAQAAGPFPVSLFPVTHESRHCGEWKSQITGGPGGGEREDNVVTPIRRVA
jgi:hypothetical protein